MREAATERLPLKTERHDCEVGERARVREAETELWPTPSTVKHEIEKNGLLEVGELRTERS